MIELDNGQCVGPLSGEGLTPVILLVPVILLAPVILSEAKDLAPLGVNAFYYIS